MDKQEVLQKIKELDQLREALVGEITGLTNTEKIELLEKAQPMVLPDTPEMEALLRGGYPDMSVEKAETIIREREQEPERWPYEQLERAQAFLAAYHGVGRGTVTSTREPWRTRPRK